MTKMRRSRTALLLLFVAIFASWWSVAAFATYTSTNNLLVTNTTAPGPTPQTAVAYVAYDGSRIVLHKAASDAEVTYSGNLSVPSSCDAVRTGVAQTGAHPTHVTLLFSITASDTGCPDTASTSVPFSISIATPPADTATFDGATVNGVIAPVTVTQTP